MSEVSNIIPQHVAIIMDGNGRWAKKRLMPRIAGHRRGVETIKKITKFASNKGIKLITLYAFSTENWGRPEDEVNFLMKLPGDFFSSFLPEMIANNCRVECIGDITRLPQETQTILKKAINESAHCTGLILNFAINYGGQQEIVEAIKAISQNVIEGKIEVNEIDGPLVEEYLFTSRFGSIAKPDLVIRTSGEQRLSNFLLWQAAYSELYFTDVLWPDFSEQDFETALTVYANRNRRFGKV